MTVRRPCRTCPWRLDQDASAIPGFSLQKAEGLANTCPGANGWSVELGRPMFACHQSTDGAEVVCAGWLAVEGRAHVGVRVNVALGEIDAAALNPGEDWPEMHRSFAEVIAKLRATAPGTRLAQGSGPAPPDLSGADRQHPAGIPKGARPRRPGLYFTFEAAT